jgi:hypothetical protein
MNSKLWLLCLVAACGGDGGGDVVVDAEDPSAFCRATARITCEQAYACLTPAEREANDFPATEPECERVIESRCESAIDSCSRSSSHGYASEAAGQCLREMDAATCNDAGEPWLDAPACDNICAPTAGAFKLKWAFNPPSYTCSQLNISTVAVYSVAKDGRNFVDTYDCYTGSGITDVLPVGSYAVHLELFDYNNQKLWAGSATSATLDRELVDLGTVTIPVSP